MMRRSCRAALLAASLVLVGGCINSGPPDPPAKPTRTVQDFPTRWFETPYLDLLSADGTFVRAIAQSYFYSHWFLKRRGFLPGYERATQNLTVFADWVSPVDRSQTPQTTYMWVAQFPSRYRDSKTRRPVRPDPRLGRAAVCVGLRQGNPRVHALFWFTYRREGKTPPANQKGPLASPIRDVFGGWKVIESVTYRAYGKELRVCDQVPGDMSPGHSASLGPDPGWPATGTE